MCGLFSEVIDSNNHGETKFCSWINKPQVLSSFQRDGFRPGFTFPMVFMLS